MARIPTRDSFRVVAGSGGGGRLNTGVAAADPNVGRQQQQLAQSVSQGSSQVVNATREANEMRVSDALNRARQRALDLTYDPESGYAALKGQSALERPDNLSLVDEYGNRFNDSVSEIAASLSNEQQRRMFQQRVGNVQTLFRGGVQRHMLSEMITYHQSVADGAFKLSQQEAELHWDDPARIDAAINGIETEEGKVGGIKQAIYQKARLTGVSANEVQAEIQTVESAIHTKVIESALANSNTTYAEEYFNQHKGSMTGGDVLSVRKVLNDQVEANNALIAVNQATTKYSTAFAPNDFQRLANILGGAGVTVGEDTSIAEQLDVKVKEYGSAEQAVAALSAGDDAVKEAVKKAEEAGVPQNWMRYLPRKAQEQVVAAIDKFASGQGGQSVPTKLEYVNEALESLSDNATPSQKNKVRELAEKQYKLLVEAREQKAESVLTQAQQMLAENGGSIAELPASLRMGLLKLDPNKLKEAADYAKAVRDGASVVTDNDTYLNVMLNQDKLADMSDAAFRHLLMTKFSPKDREDLIKVRREMMEGGSDSVETLNNTALNEALKGRFQSFGLDSKDEDDAVRIANITRFVRDDLYSIQKSQGHKLSPQDIENRVDQMFATKVEVRQSLFGYNTLYPDTTKGLFELDMGDLSNTDVSRIRDSLVRKGVREPSDELILRTYRRYRMMNPQRGK